MILDPRRLLPTKINLILLRRERAAVLRTRRILEEKRNAILLFLRAYLEEYERLYRVVYESIRAAERLFAEAAAEMGHDRFSRFLEEFEATLKVEVSATMVFTVRVPIFRVDERTYPSPPLVPGTPMVALKAIETWRSVFKDYLKVAELEQVLRLLAEELRKTQRVINAIDNVVLPTIEKALAYIRLALDERAREEFLRRKGLKRKRERLTAEAVTLPPTP